MTTYFLNLFFSNSKDGNNELSRENCNLYNVLAQLNATLERFLPHSEFSTKSLQLFSVHNSFVDFFVALLGITLLNFLEFRNCFGNWKEIVTMLFPVTVLFDI